MLWPVTGDDGKPLVVFLNNLAHRARLSITSESLRVKTPKKKPPHLRGLLLHRSSYDEAAMLAVMKQLCLNNAINGANIDALLRVIVTFALNAFVRVDFKKNVAFKDSLGRANGLTGSARNAVI